MTEYPTRQNPDATTERLNAVLETLQEPEDPFVTRTASSVLRDIEWRPGEDEPGEPTR